MSDEALISVIVPMYKAEKYLPQCLDSICGQTYKNLDIILVDDGSPDRCGEICEEYAARDQRVRVFHTENQGHYLARNLAIQKAREKGSKYIGFVDADDWIESNMYDSLYKIAEKHNADIVQCGYYWESLEETWKNCPQDRVMNSTEALYELFINELDDNLWNKFWKITCFDRIKFPAGRSHKDAATTYKLIATAETIVSTSQVFNHYRQVSDSIVHTPGIGRINLWLAHIEKYKYAKKHMAGKISDTDYQKMMLIQKKNCAMAISENWGDWYGFSKEDQRKNAAILNDMHLFSLEHFPLFGCKGWTRYSRIMCFFSHFNNRFSLFFAHKIALHRGRTKKQFYG